MCIRDSYEFSNFRKYLVFVTVLEIALSSGYIVLVCFLFYRDYYRCTYQKLEQFHIILSIILKLSVILSHGARNWAVAAITVARVEAVAQPLRLRGRRICTTLRTVIFVTFVSLSSMSYYIPVIIYVNFMTWQHREIFFSLDTALFRLLPILVVIVGTTVISVKLLRTSQIPSNRSGLSLIHI